MVMDAENSQPWNIISYRFESSKLVIEDCTFWVNKLDELGLIEGRDWECLKESIRYIPTNTYIKALPCVPKVIRGKKGNVFIDEAAHIPQLKEILDAVRPLTIWGYGITLISSPYLPGLFEELCESGKWDVRSVDIYEAVDQGLYHKIQAELNLPEPSKEECGEWINGLLEDAGKSGVHEYLCQTVEDCSGDWISEASDIRDIPVIVPLQDIANYSMTTRKKHTMGIDVGVSENPTVISVVSADGLEKMFELREKKIPEIARFIESLITPGTHKVVIDTNGIGRGLADLLSEKYPSKVVYAPNTSTWINTECVSFLSRVWSGEVSISSDPLVMSDFGAVEMVAGKLVFKQRVIDKQKRHCDSIPSLAMSYQHFPNSTDLYA